MVRKLTQLGLRLILGGILWSNVSCKGPEDTKSGESGAGFLTTKKIDAPDFGVSRKIIEPPPNGIYLGQTTFKQGEVEQLEQIIGDKIAIIADYSLLRGTERAGAPLRFDLVRANSYADRGYAIIVGAYEAYPGHTGFTVDRLLHGEYDRQLSELAAQFRQFHGQMFFSTCREPNGVLSKYYGGFGPNGDKDLSWAVRTHGGFADFHPPPSPEGASNLYAGLGRDDAADGIERLGAAQRYYYDFFVRREDLTNLTFETMGWGVSAPVIDRSYETVYEEQLAVALSFEQLLTAIGPYYDWVSINWYLDSEPQEETGFHPREGPRRHRQAMEAALQKIAHTAPNRPILITEFGILKPYREQKITEALNLIRSSQQIKGVIFWGATVEGNPFNGVLRPDEPSANILQAIIQKDPDWSQSIVISRN